MEKNVICRRFGRGKRMNRKDRFRNIFRRLFKGGLNMETGAIICECIKCGHSMSTDGHCIDISCPICDGQMRRADRPGAGR